MTAALPKKLLVVSPYRVFPLIAGGKIRVYRLARELSRQGLDVTISVPVSHNQLRGTGLGDHLDVAVAYYPLVHPYLLRDKPFPYMYLASFHPGYRHQLRRLLEHCDIVQFEHASFADLLDSIPAGKVVSYNAHNVEYDYVSAECGSDWTRRVAASRIRRLEERLIRASDVVLSCSQNDIDRFRQLYSLRPEEARFEIVPNGVHLRGMDREADGADVFQRFPGLRRFSRRALFSGSDVEHNRDAVRLILDELAPRQRDEVAFVIRGRCATRFRAARHPNVFLDSTEGDISAHASACTVGVNTVRKGSGTSMKVLHYLSLGLPVVSTDFGMRGYPELRRHVRCGKPAELVELLKARHQLSPEIGAALAPYSWARIGSSLKAIYDRVSAEKGYAGNGP